MLESQLIDAVKESVPRVDLSVDDIVSITTTTLYTMAKFSAKRAEHNRVRFLRGAGNLVGRISRMENGTE